MRSSAQRKARAPAPATPPRRGQTADDDDADVLTLKTTPIQPKKRAWVDGFQIRCEPNKYPPGSKHGTPGHETGTFSTVLDPTAKFNKKPSGPMPFNNNEAVKTGIAVGCLAEICQCGPLPQSIPPARLHLRARAACSAHSCTRTRRAWRRYNPGFGALAVKTWTAEQYEQIVKMARKIEKLGPLVEAGPPHPDLVDKDKPEISIGCDEFNINLNGHCFPLQHFLSEKGFEKLDNFRNWTKACADEEEREQTLAWLQRLGKAWGWQMLWP